MLSGFFRDHLPFHVSTKCHELFINGNQEYHHPSATITRKYSRHQYQQQINTSPQNNFRNQCQLVLNRGYYMYSVDKYFCYSFPDSLQLDIKQDLFDLLGWVGETYQL